jgi:hypothetical protein
VNASRNFTNKVWNIGKFILFNLEQVGGCLGLICFVLFCFVLFYFV